MYFCYPGTPIRQEIGDTSTATAHGDGLVKGQENHPATFYVDSHGKKGNLEVQVDGKTHTDTWWQRGKTAAAFWKDNLVFAARS